MDPVKKEENREVVDIINVGSCRFKIVDKPSLREGRVYYRRFTITSEFTEHESIESEFVENEYTDRVKLAVSFIDTQEPIYAEIEHAHNYSIHTRTDAGKFSVILRNALFQYVREKIPSITEIRLDDNTNFESTENSKLDQMDVNRFTIPISFYYFSIAFNGKTWYEYHFGARLQNPEKHEAYRKKVDWFLHSKELKSSMEYTKFLNISSCYFLQKNFRSTLEIENPFETIDKLEPYYNDPSAVTFGDFFQLIPKQDRCSLVGGWIYMVMRHFFDDVFSNRDWVIDIPMVTNDVKTNDEPYYCPEGQIWNTAWGTDVGASPFDD